jgi:hypothetical protein
MRPLKRPREKSLRHNENLVRSRIFNFCSRSITRNIDHCSVRFERAVNKPRFSRYRFRDRKLRLVSRDSWSRARRRCRGRLGFGLPRRRRRCGNTLGRTGCIRWRRRWRPFRRQHRHRPAFIDGRSLPFIAATASAHRESEQTNEDADTNHSRFYNQAAASAQLCAVCKSEVKAAIASSPVAQEHMKR